MFSTSFTNLQPLVKKNNSKVLCIVGATHGDEPAGIHAIETIASHFANEAWNVEGIDIFGVVGNPEAFSQNIRFVEHNLNRMFQDKYLTCTESQASEVKRAQELSGYFKQLQNEYTKVYVLDLHSVSLSDIQMTVCRTQDTESRELLKKICPIKLNFVFEEEHIPGTVSGYTSSIGCVGIGIEAGSHASANAKFVALEIIEALLDEVAAFNTKKVSYKNVPSYLPGDVRTYTTIERIISARGFRFTIEQASELFIGAGSVYGENNQGLVIAKQDCYMMMPPKNPSEEDWDAGFLCVKS